MTEIRKVKSVQVLSEIVMVHRNNSAEVEDAIQAFLGTKTQISTLEGVKQVTMRDKARVLVQPFAPSSGSLFDDQAVDPLLAFLEKGGTYATDDRSRVYRSEITTSGHPDVQNPDRVLEMMQDMNVDWRTSFVSDQVRRPSLDASQMYHELRRCQNANWAEATTKDGILLMQQQNYDKAIRAFQHALELEPTYVSASAGLGSAYMAKEMYKDAIAVYESVLRADPMQENTFEMLNKAIDQSHSFEYRRLPFYKSLLALRDRSTAAVDESRSRHRGRTRSRSPPRQRRTKSRSRSNNRRNKRRRSRTRSGSRRRRSRYRSRSAESRRSSRRYGRESRYEELPPPPGSDHLDDGKPQRNAITPSRDDRRHDDDRYYNDQQRRSHDKNRYQSRRKPRSRSREGDRRHDSRMGSYYRSRSRSRDRRSRRSTYHTRSPSNRGDNRRSSYYEQGRYSRDRSPDDRARPRRDSYSHSKPSSRDRSPHRAEKRKQDDRSPHVDEERQKWRDSRPALTTTESIPLREEAVSKSDEKANGKHQNETEKDPDKDTKLSILERLGNKRKNEKDKSSNVRDRIVEYKPQ